MAQPNYKLKDDHVATCGHVRGLYQRVIDEFHAKTEDILMSGRKVKNLGFMEPGSPTLNAPDRSDAVPKVFLYDHFSQKTNVYERDYIDEQLDLKINKSGTTPIENALTYAQQPIMVSNEDIPSYGIVLTEIQDQAVLKTGDAMTGFLTLNDDPTSDLHAATKKYVDDGLASKQDAGGSGTISKIQNSTGFTHVSCDNDRYISVKSMNNKLCDIHEDEANEGMTIATYGKRFNLVSSQPQTYYHNSPAGLFNFKYTDNASQTPGQAIFGQIQLSPSNTTNLNPAVTIQSARINGLGNVGAIFLDSTYGTAPLVISPQTITDTNANSLSMLRDTVPIPPGSNRNTFTHPTGYSSGVSIQNPLQFPTKQYVDDSIEAARNNVTQLVDANTGETPVTNNYKLRIDNNQLEFYRGLNSDDVWLKFFGSTTTSSDAVVQQTNRSNYYFESTDDTSPLNSIWLRYASSVPQAIRDLEAPLRFQQGYDNTNNIPFCRISAVSQANFNNNTTILMYPSDERITFADKIVFNRRAGYQVGVESQGFSETSILSRSENDVRYYLKTTPLNTITAPTSNVSLNSQRITNLANPIDDQDAATKSWTLSQVSSGQIISFKIRCGDVPFTSGSDGAVNTYTVNSTNFPLNQSNIVSQALWVRQSGRSDTIRFLITLDSAVTQGRPFIVQCQNQTTFVNSSGGPTNDWRFGDSTENYIVQTFDLRADIARFGLHIRDLGAATSQSLLLNCSVIF